MKEFQDRDAILILSDMEGVSGLIDDRLLSSGGKFWMNYGRYLLTEDINAIALSLCSKGIKRIYLSENHNFGRNVVVEELLPFITILPPHSANTNMWGRSFWDELYRTKGIIGAIMVGFPGMAGAGGYLSHSWDNKIFEYIKINGEEYGAIGTTAALLGEYNIPVIAVIGDEAAAKEATKVNANITTVIVKKMSENNWISVLPPDIAHNLISKKVPKALDNLPNIKPFKVRKPVKIEFKVKKEDYLNVIEDKEEVKIDGKIIVIEASNYREAYNIFWDCYLGILFGGTTWVM